jgi:Zn-dependent protease with chaperone function
MVALGSLALAATALRTGRWLAARIVAARNLGKLLRLGEPSAEGPDIVCVDGSAILCHATGGWNPCVLVSTQLLSKISPELLSAALDHERAHLKRRDVLTRDLLSVLGLLAWPGIGNITVDAWEEAAEEAADAAAAMRHGGHTVARALVAVARLSLTPKPATMPIIGAGVTRRVHALLNGPPTHWPALALGLVPITGLVLVGVAAIHADPLHHVVESVLYFILGA